MSSRPDYDELFDRILSRHRRRTRDGVDVSAEPTTKLRQVAAERDRRLRAALAEAGHPDVRIDIEFSKDGRAFRLFLHDTGIPHGTVWRASFLSGHMRSVCWPCFSQSPFDDASRDCDHDPLTSPWPEVVR